MQPRPHFVFIFSDQQHFRATGCRDLHFHTPHWDAFARDGIRFDTAYCTTPLCSPSRATLMTGLMPHRCGVTNNGVPLQQSTIAPRLQSAGYHTAYFGKWHLHAEPAAIAGWSEQRGVCDEYVPPNRPLSDSETRDAALDFLARAGALQQPCATFVSFDEPHGVYWVSPRAGYGRQHCAMPPLRDETRLPCSWHAGPDPTIPVEALILPGQQEFLRTLANDEHAWRVYREVYRDRVAAFDTSLGAILNALRRHGLYDEALIVLTSDHGDMDAHHRLAFKGPAPYEELQRVPLAIKPPNSWQTVRGRVDARSLVSLADLFPTLLEAAGTPLPPCDGLSLLPVLRGQNATHARDLAVVQWPGNAYRTIRQGAWKYSLFRTGAELLFNLDQDPYEECNLARAASGAGQAAQMRAALQRWCEAEADGFFSSKN